MQQYSLPTSSRLPENTSSKDKKVTGHRVLQLTQLTPGQHKSDVNTTLLSFREGSIGEVLVKRRRDRLIELFVQDKVNRQVQLTQILTDELVHHRKVLLHDLGLDTRVLQETHYDLVLVHGGDKVECLGLQPL